jgi:glutathione synthase/RimK-type ligase-like ATP-grasp enzyme
MTLLLAGGHEDPNLTVLANAAQKTDIELLDLRLPAGESPAFCWELAQGAPQYSGKKIKATGAFIRHDVFSGMKDPRPEVSTRASGWYQTMMGWLLAEPGIRLFNRQIDQAAMNKPAALVLAREAGLRVPTTWITNAPGDFANGRQEAQQEMMIAKPVLGGDYCYTLAEALEKTALRDGLAATPAIVQKRLVAPEIRIYVIGQSSFAFEVRSGSLDYRVNQDAELIFLPQTPQEVSLLRKLMLRLGMDFGAADFKTDPETGQLVFLELNTSPMFARFDRESGGQLCAAIIHELTAAQEKR